MRHRWAPLTLARGVLLLLAPPAILWNPAPLPPYRRAALAFKQYQLRSNKWLRASVRCVDCDMPYAVPSRRGTVWHLTVVIYDYSCVCTLIINSLLPCDPFMMLARHGIMHTTLCHHCRTMNTRTITPCDYVISIATTTMTTTNSAHSQAPPGSSLSWRENLQEAPCAIACTRRITTTNEEHLRD